MRFGSPSGDLRHANTQPPLLDANGRFGLSLLLISTIVFLFVPRLVRHMMKQPFSAERFHSHVLSLQMGTILIGVFVSAWALIPALTRVADYLRPRWKTVYTGAALLSVCAFLSAFIIHFGNRQFGAWDFGNLIDTGWRQILGQRPYVDFICPNPPGFNLGIKYAFQIFGVDWNAQLYFTAIFSSASFLWLYWLMWRLVGAKLAAFWTAFAIECFVVLPLAFWWYNNSTSILAAVFFLSCLLYSEQSNSFAVQSSLFASLAVLPLMKPNIAGLTVIAGLILLFIIVEHKGKLLLLTLGAALATIVVIYANGISVPAMLASYRSIAIERGVLSNFGLRELDQADMRMLVVKTLILALPAFGLLPALGLHLRRRQWRRVAFYLFFPIALLIAIYGMRTNNDVKDVECGMLLAAGAVIIFSAKLPERRLRRFYLAAVCAIALSDVYIGAARLRVLGIGEHEFFEWDGNVPVGDNFFKDDYASQPMRDVVREITEIKSSNPGPFFMGPRLEFMYAVVQVPSPMHLPVYWQPGTSFARADEGKLIRVWRHQPFKTLIFLKGDYTFYSPGFIAIIDSKYQRDDNYPWLTVYRARNALEDGE